MDKARPSVETDCPSDVTYDRALVEDLLEIVRARTGKAVLRRARIEIKALIAESLEIAAPAIREHGQHVEVLLPGVPTVIEGDALRLRQVFVNLVANASKFSARGATI